MKAWWVHVQYAWRTVFRRWAEAPFGHALTVLGLGVSLILLAVLFMVLMGAQRAVDGLPAQGAVLVYANPHASDVDQQQLSAQIDVLPKLAHKQFISRAAALSELTQKLALGGMAHQLPDNLLPDTWILTPSVLDVTLIQQWTQALAALPAVMLVQSDTVWVGQLRALVNTGRHVVLLLAGLLALGLVSILGLAVRLQIVARLPEIDVSRMIGATDHFIARPFLYFGLLEGLLAGLVAVFGVWLLTVDLLPRLDVLLRYEGQTSLIVLPSLQTQAAFVLASALLGWLGAWLAVRQALWR